MMMSIVGLHFYKELVPAAPLSSYSAHVFVAALLNVAAPRSLCSVRIRKAMVFCRVGEAIRIPYLRVCTSLILFHRA